MTRLGPATALGLLMPLALAAQLPPATTRADADSAVHAFLIRARQGTARYTDRAQAIADGFRPIGVESPGMGQHWVHIGRLLAGEVDAARPEILNYATVDGRAMLVGVGYAIPARDTADLPGTPVPRTAWHFHGSTVEDEELLATHRMAGVSDTALRVAVLHAWIWVANPEGTFVPDNWALPWVRLGLAPPPDAPIDASRAVSLVSGGEDFLAALMAHVGRADPDATARIRAVLSQAHADLEQRVRSLAAGGRIDPADVAWLADRWNTMLRNLERVVPDTVWIALRPMRDTH